MRMILRIRLPAVPFPFVPLTEDPLATAMENFEGKSAKELPYVFACPSSYEVRVRWCEVWSARCDYFLDEVNTGDSRSAMQSLTAINFNE